jgi:hypothetical protein
MTTGLRHSPEARRRIAEATRAAMAAPAVRQKISECTKLGMRTPATELKLFRGAWRGARSSVRGTFIAEELAPLFDGPEGGA